MKLLSPSEAREKAKKSKEAENYRLVEVQTLIAAKLKELGEAERAFDETMQKQRNQWAAEEQEHTNKKVTLEREVLSLEERRRQALVPLTEREKALDTRTSALDERESRLDMREAALDEKGELLEHRLDEVAEREIQATSVARTLTQREEGIKTQAAQVAISSNALTAAMSKAADDSSKREQALNLREAAIKAKEGNVAERERKLGEKEKDLVIREAVLKDRYATLLREIDEVEKKYGSSFTKRPESNTDSGGSV